MTELSVGKPFELFTGKDMRGRDGAVFESLEEGYGFAFVVYLSNMKEEERNLLWSAKISVRMIQETDSFTLALLRFGNSPMIFEVVFDPTLYGDNRASQLTLKNNLVNIIGVESNTNIIQTLRVVSMPRKLMEKWRVAWDKAREQADFTEKYHKWVRDLDNRYSVFQLWDYASYIGKMGE